MRNAAYTSIAFDVTKEMLGVAAQRTDGLIETCLVAGDPSAAPWAFQVLPGASVPAGGNLQLAHRATEESLFLFVPRVQAGVESIAYYRMPATAG